MSHSKEQWMELERLEAEEADRKAEFEMTITTKYAINNADMGIPYNDSGEWRSYSLGASGDGLYELIQDATIEEIDQDGGTLASYGLDEASTVVLAIAERMILDMILKKDSEARHPLYNEK